VNLGLLLAKAELQPETPPPAPDDPAAQKLIQQAQQERALAEQQIQTVIDETIRRAKTLINSDPDGAYELLKRQRQSVADNDQIGNKIKQTLLSRLDSQLRDVDLRGRAIKQKLQEETDRLIRAERERAAAEERKSLEEKSRERIRAFVSLMNQARYEEAYKEALVLSQEAVSKGQPIPVEATASYNMALTATNLREVQELRRIREERFLITMMQVEKSHVPYPDEPPVHFPPAAVWKQLSDVRKSRYDSSGLGPETPTRTKELAGKLSKVVDIERAIQAPLKDVLEFLSDRFDLTLIVDPAAFKALEPPVDSVEDVPVRLPRMPGVTLSTVLRLVLSPIGGTYLVRRDYIEITTSREAIREKAVRAYEVADLVFPIPNSINQASLNQSLQVLGGTFSFGAAGSPFNAFGNAGIIGGFNALGVGGGLAGIGGIGGGLGGLGGLGGINAAGIGGALGMGGMGGGVIGFGMGGNNLGAGGGVTGFGGGQLGQFGNLGGQFGLQGGDQSAILVQLIIDVVARGEWARAPGYLQQQLGQGGMNMGEEEQNVLPTNELNSLGYYPPARALVVRATSRVHSRLGGGLLNPRGAAGGGNMGQAPAIRNRDDVLVFDGRTRTEPKGAAPAKPAIDPKQEYAKAKGKDLDARRVWHDAFAKADIKDKAGWVVAVLDFLGQVKEFGHAAEVLKTNLRQGFTSEPWVFEALGVALMETGGSTTEVERARLSAIDVNPKDPQAYLRAAKAMADLGRHDRAIGFCKQAAALQPETPEPYADALVYLDKSKTVDSDSNAWAISNLLRREWSTDKEMFHAHAGMAMESVQKRLLAEKRDAEAARLAEAISKQQQRDLVIELSYRGDADVDMKIAEPIGSICSPFLRQTPAGSLYVADLGTVRQLDNLTEKDPAKNETYTVAEAFSGSYEVTVSAFRGRPLGGRAMLKVTRHQGTPEQTVEYITVNTDKPEAIKISLSNGRRTKLAMVAPPTMSGHPDKERVLTNSSVAIARLRALADPTYAVDPMAIRGGGVSASGNRLDAVYDMSKSVRPSADLSLQTGIESPLGHEFTAKAQIEGKELRIKLQPVFQTADKTKDEPVIVNPLLPGGN